MISELLFFTLLQLAFGFPIEHSSRELDTRSALQPRGLATGSKVAIGLCVPGGALVVGLGIGIMCLYPRQLRKLREENPGAEVGLRELMEGRVTKPAAPQVVDSPPPYEERRGSVTKDTSLTSSDPPAQPATNATSGAVLPSAVEARHAALMS